METSTSSLKEVLPVEVVLGADKPGAASPPPLLSLIVGSPAHVVGRLVGAWGVFSYTRMCGRSSPPLETHDLRSFRGTQEVLLESGKVEVLDHPQKTLWVKGKGVQHGLTRSFAWLAQSSCMLQTATKEQL